MKNFEDKLSEIQTDMISLALELAEDKIDTAYIYGSYENNSLSFNSFFVQDDCLKSYFYGVLPS